MKNKIKIKVALIAQEVAKFQGKIVKILMRHM